MVNLNLLEEKIKSLLLLVTHLKEENEKLKSELKEGASSEVMLDLKKRQELRAKIEGMLELLKDY
jgi:cell division septum initiation protein DivIVA